SDYYFILNSDVELLPGSLKPLVDLLESDKTIAACQPKLLTWSNKKLFEYAGGAGGWLDKYGYPFAKGRIFDVFEEDNGQYDKSEPIFWASGAALFIRANVFQKVKQAWVYKTYQLIRLLSGQCSLGAFCKKEEIFQRDCWQIRFII